MGLIINHAAQFKWRHGHLAGCADPVLPCACGFSLVHVSPALQAREIPVRCIHRPGSAYKSRAIPTPHAPFSRSASSPQHNTRSGKVEKQSPGDTDLSVSCLDHTGQSSSTVHLPRFTVKLYASRGILSSPDGHLVGFRDRLERKRFYRGAISVPRAFRCSQPEGHTLMYRHCWIE